VDIKVATIEATEIATAVATTTATEIATVMNENDSPDNSEMTYQRTSKSHGRR